MSEEANLGVGICEKQKKYLQAILGIYGHSLKENFELLEVVRSYSILLCYTVLQR